MVDWKRLLVLFLVLGALVYVVFRIGFSDILRVLPRAFQPGLVVFWFLYVVVNLLRGVRWRVLLGDESMSLWEGFRLIFLTSFYNLVSPVRVGDLWRVKECRLSGLGRC